MNLYLVTCNYGKAGAEDRAELSIPVRAESEDQACKDALQKRFCSSKWKADARILVKDIDLLEKRNELFPRMLDALKKVDAMTDADFAMDGVGFVHDLIKEIEL